jgi:hypothetical protein
LESPLGTGMFWFGEVLNSATDSIKSRADTVDNQIDVIGKAFLGVTLACARCHDHKFDPIPTRDYYAMAGVMHSTGVREAVIDSPARTEAVRAAHERIIALNRQPRLGPEPASAKREGDELFEDFSSYNTWLPTGEAFRKQWEPGFASSLGGGTTKLVGSLTSRKFVVPKVWLHVRIAGEGGDTKLVERNPLRLTLVADDYKSVHISPTGKPGFHWKTARMTLTRGRLSYFEIVDRDPNGWLAVDRIVFSDNEKPPENSPGSNDVELKPDPERAALEHDFPTSSWGLLSRDDDPHDVPVHIRGNHKNLGDMVPRGGMSALPAHIPHIAGGSGRKQLADWIADPANPLTARVFVNRIWKHHFRTGLVRTADNFGQTGDRPSNPELLDWVAQSFIDNGWSTKAMHRLIVLSSAYRMSSAADPGAARIDPRNDLLSHFPVRRLEAETVRDSVLAVSGRLRPTLFGPSVVPYISSYQEGRGKPKPGPLDGDGRRSIYIQVRRNFLTPMFLAFDYPLPISTIGSRSVSTVPSQALLMWNNEFVASQAARWAERVGSETDPEKRLERMYMEAFARLPEDWERRETLAFASNRGWTELAHLLLNSAEFLYVR